VIFSETPLRGAFLVDLEKHSDDRGFFARTFCRHEFEAHGLNANVVQCNISWNARAGTLRGMHFQRGPTTEAKLVRCTRGALHDIIVDLRPESATYRSHFAIELNTENRRALFIPENFAHGFLTLTDDTEVEYQMSEFYAPGSASGFRYDDPAFKLKWPRTVEVISKQDLSWSRFS
jgi:dTDP-4-dehydrorhamnose 3,5-epimerase